MSDNTPITKDSVSSTEINVNAKGQVSFSVKVYNCDPVLATNDAVKIIEKLKEKYKNEFSF
jgi:hypothetical protein